MREDEGGSGQVARHLLLSLGREVREAIDAWMSCLPKENEHRVRSDERF